MKTTAPAVAIVLLILVLNSVTSEAVQVEVEGLTFSLEDVQMLQRLTKTQSQERKVSPRLMASVGSVCSNPMLPHAFRELCDQSKRASSSLNDLIMMPMDVCEICAYVACTGC